MGPQAPFANSATMRSSRGRPCAVTTRRSFAAVAKGFSAATRNGGRSRASILGGSKRAQVAQRDPVEGARSHEQALQGDVTAAQPLPPRTEARRPHPFQIGADPARRGGGEPVGLQGDAPVRARPHAQIVAAAPIDQIVARAGRRPLGVVGNLIGLEARRPENRLSRLVEVGGQVGPRRREGAPPDGAVEGGARLDGELVGRQVLGPQGDGLGELSGPGRRGLAGQGVDQVERETREKALAAMPRRGGRRRRHGCAPGISARRRSGTEGPRTGARRRPGRNRRSGPPRRRWDWPPG